MKILVVDDSSTFRTIARKELEKGGYEIIEAVDGEEALKILSTTPIDLITLDIEMPGMNGYETYKKLSGNEFRDASEFLFEIPPVIFVTSLDSLEERRKGFDVGALNYVTKPFASGELLGLVNSHLYPETEYEGMKVLIADDSSTLRKILVDIFQKEGITVFEAKDGEEAFQIFQKNLKDIDLIISDFVMPNVSGIGLCKKIRVDLNHKGVPIILMSGEAENSQVLEMFKAGATDYLNKPFAKEELLALIKVHMEVRFKNRQLSKTVSELKRLTRKLDEISRTDPLTGLSNRRDILEHCKNEHSRLDRNGKAYSIILCDIDFFKKVNDENGHDVGDYVLVEVAKLLKQSLREVDKISRWGGEEFLIILPECELEGASQVGEKMRETIESHNFQFKGTELRLTMSFGVTCHSDKAMHFEETIKTADEFLYKAKEGGRNQVVSC